MEYIGIVAIVAIIQGLICGKVSSFIAKNKGYNESIYYWLGFCFCYIGIIVAAVLPDKTIFESLSTLKSANTNQPVKGGKYITVNIDEWYDELPFGIVEGRIYLRSELNQASLTLEMINLGFKDIKSIYIDIECLDEFSDPVSENNRISYAYQDMDVMQNANFGSNDFITLPNSLVRKIVIHFNKMLFIDGTILRVEDIAHKVQIVPFVRLTTLKPERVKVIEENVEKVKGYNCEFIPYDESPNKWRCCCGFVNNMTDYCHRCSRSKKMQFDAFSENFYIKKQEENKEKEKEEDQKRQEQAEAKQRKRRKMVIFFSSICLVLFILISSGWMITKAVSHYNSYNNAVSLVDQGNYMAAAYAFENLDDYKDSKAKLKEILPIIKSNTDIYMPYIAAGASHTVGLKSDGTVIAVGWNKMYGQCDVSDWKDIVAIAAGRFHTLGLKADGTVVNAGEIAVGVEKWGTFDVSGWKDIVAIETQDWLTFGLKADGTVVAIGYNKWGDQCDVSDWKEIVAIASDSHVVGLRSDGTVVASGENRCGECDVSDWKGIVAIAAGEGYTLGLKADGTVIAVGDDRYGECDVFEWKNIVAISADFRHTVGLKADGTVIAVGDNEYGECDVSDWKGIVAIDAGAGTTVGLKADGTVIAVGGNESGQLNVSNWSGIGPMTK